jgi:hypothetical protein
VSKRLRLYATYAIPDHVREFDADREALCLPAPARAAPIPASKAAKPARKARRKSRKPRKRRGPKTIHLLLGRRGMLQRNRVHSTASLDRFTVWLPSLAFSAIGISLV